jgi:hypothetical protein
MREAFGLYSVDARDTWHYHGIDSSKAMIDKARQIHINHAPGNVSFFDEDALSCHWTKSYYRAVVSSGMLNIDQGNNLQAMSQLLKLAFTACSRVAVVNMLSVLAPHYTAGRYYYDPAKMLRIALKLTPKVELYHNYLPNDFTIAMYR